MCFRLFDSFPRDLQWSRRSPSQHLQDMTNASAGAGGTLLLRALTAFTNLVLKGTVPIEIWPSLFGVSLTALTKKDGGTRPIAVGCTLRRLVAKTASTCNEWVPIWHHSSLVIAQLLVQKRQFIPQGSTSAIYLLIMFYWSLISKMHSTVWEEIRCLRQLKNMRVDYQTEE